MQDHPTYDQLLEAVSIYLRERVMPNTTGQVSFHARVAANALDWVRAELLHEEEHLAREWEGLDHLLGVESMPPTIPELRETITRRNHELSGRIRDLHADEGQWRADLLRHCRRVVYDKLVVANPRLAREAEQLMGDQLRGELGP
jgi:hypothetical protein